MMMTNKFNMFDNLYYYDKSSNEIKVLRVTSITFDYAIDGEIKYNYFWGESSLYKDRFECLDNVLDFLHKEHEDKVAEVEKKLHDTSHEGIDFSIPIEEN